ncbi:MAG: helix-turn-helix transcriptional regulator [Selenomonadaceae bacterium]|nr:helix-turn-helix transcriptional regulator [Selenomonadaceae bacterium]
MTEDKPIKTARVKSGKTQPQVAKELRIDIRLYQRYEHGEVTPNAKVGNRIARALGTTSEKLWGY